MAERTARPTEEALGYQAIADELREQIRLGFVAPGAFLPTERELVEQFGVSRSTVRRALTALAQSGWAEVKPNRGVAARFGPMKERTNNVAFVDHGDVLDKELFFAISRRLQKRGLNLVHIDTRTKDVEAALEDALEQDFAAALVWSKKGFPDPARIKAVQQQIPVIAVDHGLRTVASDVIVEDNLGGGRLAVQHLAKQGRKRIAVSGMMDMLEINHERFSGYLMGLFDYDLQPSPRDFLFCHTSGMEAADTHDLERRLHDEDRPDAVFIMQDMFAPAVVHTIFRCGLRIPEDVALVALGHGSGLHIDDVALTRVTVDIADVADASVELLMRRLELPSAAIEQIVLPVRLEIGGSCGAPRADWEPGTTAHATERLLMATWDQASPPLHIRSHGTTSISHISVEAQASRRNTQ